MDNNFDKNKTSQPNDTAGAVGSKTYTGVPEFFENKNAVSQNRSTQPDASTKVNNAKPFNPQQQGRPMGANNGKPFNPQQQGRPMGANNGQPFNPQQQGRPMGANNGQPFNPQQQNRPMGANNGQPFNPQQQGRPMGANNGQPFNPNQQSRPMGANNGQPFNPQQQGRPMGVNNGQPFNPQQQGRPMGVNNAKPFNPTQQNRPAGVNQEKKFDNKPITADNVSENKPENKLENNPVNGVKGVQKDTTTQLPAFMNTDVAKNNQPKRDVKYNYQALTPPDKKTTSIVIAIFVVTILALIVGLVGLSISLGGTEGFKDQLAQFAGNVEAAFAATPDDYQYSNDDADDYHLIGENQYNTSNLTVNTLAYPGTDISVDVYSPAEFELDSNIDNRRVSYQNPNTGIVCRTELVKVTSDDEAELEAQLVNPYDEDLLSFENLESEYSDSMFVIEFPNRSEVATFINLGEDVILSIKAVNSVDTDVDYNELAKVVEIFEDNLELY